MQRRLGSYCLLRRLSSDGMAETYLAVAQAEDGTERRVAIKLLPPHSADDPQLGEMLLQQARLYSQLRHRNIVATHDLAQQGDRYYLVMELVEGLDLFQALQRAAEQQVAFSFEVAAYVAREVALGLDYAHRKLDDSTGQPLRVVHRDVSPHNVLLSWAGEVKLTDFGIAQLIRWAAPTQAGARKSWSAYLSPEQAWGDPVDARTDIFSTGLLLHEMLCGPMFHWAKDPSCLLQRVRRADIPPPGSLRPGVPRDLEQIVMKALRRRPSDRWPTAGDLAQALRDFLHGYAPTCQPERELAALLVRLNAQPARSDPDGDEATAAQPPPTTPVPPLGPAVRHDPSPQPPVPTRREENPWGGPTRIEVSPPSPDRLNADHAGRAEPTGDARPVPPCEGTAEIRGEPPSPPPFAPPGAPPAAPLPASSPEPSSRPSPLPRPLGAMPSAVPSSLSSCPPPAVPSPDRGPRPHAAPARRAPVPSERSPWPERRGMLAAFLLALAVGAGGVLAALQGPWAPPGAQLEVVSAPPGATVLLDGRPVETPTPVRILGVDTRRVHRLTIELAGYRPWQTEVRFHGGERSRAVQAVLVPAP